MKQAILTILLGGLLAAAPWGYLYFKNRPGFDALVAPKSASPVDPNEAAKAPVSKGIFALGRIEPVEGMTEVGGIAGDRVKTLVPKEGDLIQEGTVLATLESQSLRLAEWDLAKRQLDEATQLEAIETRYAKALEAEALLAAEAVDLQTRDIEAQKSKIALLKTNLQVAESDRDRAKRLREQDATLVSEQEIEHAELLVARAEAELQSGHDLDAKLQDLLDSNRKLANAKLATAKAALDRIPGAAHLESLRKSVELAEARLKMTTLLAPRAGTVMKIVTKAGENIGPKPILLLADLSRMCVVAEVYENDLRMVEKGARATITSLALAEKLTGAVARVGNMVADHEVVSLNPTDRADMRVVKARIDLDPESAAAAAKLIHLQVTVEIEPRPTSAEKAPPRKNLTPRGQGRPSPDEAPKKSGDAESDEPSDPEKGDSEKPDDDVADEPGADAEEDAVKTTDSEENAPDEGVISDDDKPEDLGKTPEGEPMDKPTDKPTPRDSRKPRDPVEEFPILNPGPRSPARPAGK